MVESTSSPNPYQTDHGRLFFGRQPALDWIESAVARSLSAAEGSEYDQPVLLYGPPQIGKTAILKQIEAGALGGTYTAVYIDLEQVPLDSLSTFLWQVASQATLTLNRQNIELASFHQPDFIADPYSAFRTQFLQPAITALNNKHRADKQRLIFLFDNLSRLLSQIEAGILGEHTLLSLHQHLRQNDAACLFAWDQVANDDLQLPPPLVNSQMYEIKNLNQEETAAFVKQPVNYTVVQDVAHYVYQLTSGHPAQTQKLCRALFERQQKLNLQHITVADVAIVKKYTLANGHQPAVAPEQPAYKLKTNPALLQKLKRARRNSMGRRNRRPLLLVGALLLLLLAAGLLWPAITGRSITQQAAAWFGPPTATPTSTPTVAPSATPEPLAEESAVGAAGDTSETAFVPTDTPAPTNTPFDTATPTETPTSTPTATPSRYPLVLTREQDGMLMIQIPADTFLMGSSEDDFLAAPDERPQHSVVLDRFYIDKYEVTVEQYAAFLNRLGTYVDACERIDCAWPRQLAGYTSYLIEEDLGDGMVQYVPVVGYADYPINHVSWYGANAYCRSVGARLPTEAEWEYAARGTDGRLYPWGNKAPEPALAVFQSEDFDNLKPVDALPDGASPFGVFGMAGSVWEWTADWYDENYYEESPRQNPTGPETGFARVIRGGAWPFNNEADRIRAANRSSLAPDFISSTVGFRCAFDP